MISTFYLPAHLSVLLPQLFYWFFLVYFLSYYVVHLCLFFKSSLFKTFLVSSWSMPPFFFWDFESYLPLLLWIIFQVDCLSSSLPLVVILGFNFVASPAHISLVFSFCLSVFVVSFPQTAGSQFLLLLVSGPWWMRGWSWGEVGVLVGGTGICPLVSGVGSYSSGGRGGVRGCDLRWLWAQCNFRQPVSSWVTLYSYLLCCLAWGFPALEAVGCWVGLGLGAKIGTS